jgi:hypothetical protein
MDTWQDRPSKETSTVNNSCDCSGSIDDDSADDDANDNDDDAANPARSMRHVLVGGGSRELSQASDDCIQKVAVKTVIKTSVRNMTLEFCDGGNEGKMMSC